MVIKTIRTIDRLSGFLVAAHKKNYTGRIDVQAAESGENWSIYFSEGQLVWCIGGQHWRRRLRRLLYQYCRYIKSSEINLKGTSQEYYLLKQWVNRGLLKKESAQAMIEDNLVEVLFDILQLESKEQLVFKLSPNDKLISCLPSINLKLALIKSNESWKQWCENNLSALSPNKMGYSVLPSQCEQLNKQIQRQTDYSYPELLRSLDDNSLRDIALLLNKPLIQVAIELNNYWRDNFHVHEIKDLSPDKPFTHLCPSFSNLGSEQVDTRKILAEQSTPNKNNSSIQTKYRTPSKWTILTVILALLAVGGYAFSTFYKFNNFSALTPKSDKTAVGEVLSRSQTQDITLLGDTFSGYSTFRNPNFQKALQKEGIALHYQSEFDQNKRAEKLNAGGADLLVTTLDQFLIQQPQGKIVGLIDTTAGADAVVLNNKKYPQLKSLQDLSQIAQHRVLAGEKLKIAFAGNTPSEYLALLLSTKFQGLDLSNFQVIRTADAADAWKLLLDQRQGIAVAVLWEPFVSQSRKLGYNVTLSSRDVPNSIVDVVVASDRLLQERPKLISSVLSAYYRRLDTTLTTQEQLLDQIADDGNLPALDAANVLSGIKFFTAIEARSWLRQGTLEKTIGYTAGVLTLTGKLNRPLPDFQQLYNTEFIEKSASNTEKTIALVRTGDPDMAAKLQRKKIPPSLRGGDRATSSAGQDIGQLKIEKEILFQTSSDQITLEGKQVLDRLVQDVEQFNPETVAIHIIGHTTKVGEANFNLLLSQDRAQAVANYLRTEGQLKHKIVLEGKGSDEPLPNMQPNDTRNQRTEIRLERKN